MQVAESKYIAGSKPLLRKLQKELSARYAYASILAADSREKNYSVSARGISLADSDRFGKRGFCARVYDGGAYAEYAGNEIREDMIPAILEEIGTSLRDMGKAYPRLATPLLPEEELSFSKSTEYEKHPAELGDEAIISALSGLRKRTLGRDERLLDCMANLSYQEYHKLFLSDKRELEQNVLWTCGALMVVARKDEEIKDAYRGFSGMCGAELMDKMEDYAPEVVSTCLDLLNCEPLVPGEYTCVCTPEVTGMIVHEAFGHGVEMDMFVKDRALAKSFMGQKVASDIVNMRDGAASACEVASFFFDDEGNVAHDTLVIDHGTLVSGYVDAVSAARLGVPPTGNGRRESVERKAYTRMTNTFFEAGDSTVEEMIASVEDGLLLGCPTSGMEDPKNWGIQCMVSFAKEIKHGKLTGRIFSPVVLTGYVPDLLKSISMISDKVELGGGGYCGKGHKEWVKVSDGGPWIKARIRLG